VAQKGHLIVEPTLFSTVYGKLENWKTGKLENWKTGKP
jgi:hypothetical protein